MSKNFQTILLETCPSTMDEAKKIAASQTLTHIFCVVAQEQTSGRGRGGSRWEQSLSLPEAQKKPAKVQFSHQNF